MGREPKGTSVKRNGGAFPRVAGAPLRTPFAAAPIRSPSIGKRREEPKKKDRRGCENGKGNTKKEDRIDRGCQRGKEIEKQPGAKADGCLGPIEKKPKEKEFRILIPRKSGTLVTELIDELHSVGQVEVKLGLLGICHASESCKAGGHSVIIGDNSRFRRWDR